MRGKEEERQETILEKGTNSYLKQRSGIFLLIRKYNLPWVIQIRDDKNEIVEVDLGRESGEYQPS